MKSETIFLLSDKIGGPWMAISEKESIFYFQTLSNTRELIRRRAV